MKNPSQWDFLFDITNDLTDLMLRWRLCSAAARAPMAPSSSSLEPRWWWSDFPSWAPGGSRLFVLLPVPWWFFPPVWLASAMSSRHPKKVERCFERVKSVSESLIFAVFFVDFFFSTYFQLWRYFCFLFGFFFFKFSTMYAQAHTGSFTVSDPEHLFLCTVSFSPFNARHPLYDELSID